MRRRSHRLLLGLLALVGAEPRAPAHDGPPYPVIVDAPTRYGRLSAWGDPDVGTGTFWIDLEPASGVPPGDARVSVSARPADGGLEAPRCDARSIQATDEVHRFQCEVELGAPGPWMLRIDLSGDRGQDAVERPVEVTLPGQGPVLDFILYAFPFAAVGVLFILAIVRRRRGYTAAPEPGAAHDVDQDRPAAGEPRGGQGDG